MIPIKTPADIAAMRESCQVAATVLEHLARLVAPGITTYELDQEARKLMESLGARSACYNYELHNRRYPAHTCLSINEEVIHGIGSLRRVLKPGDVISLDVVVSYRGYIGDNARTVPVGRVSPEVESLLRTAEAALYRGIDKARSGNRVADISRVIQGFVESRGMSVVREFCGHGVGRAMHEEPEVPNYITGKSTPKLRPGMTLAIEPMVNLGRADIEIADDGWTAVAKDRKPSAHFEHTVLVTAQGPQILTLPPSVAVQKSA